VTSRVPRSRRGASALHGITAYAYGHERDTLDGQPLPAEIRGRLPWADFFREHLLYAARVAREAGRLPAEPYRRIEELASLMA